MAVYYDDVQKIYIAYYGRPADAVEVVNIDGDEQLEIVILEKGKVGLLVMDFM